MKKPQELKQEIVDLLLERLSNEYTAFYHYRAASNWCKGVGLNKAADYFKKESKDELKHAQGIENYLFDWNVIVELPTIQKPIVEFINVVDIIEKSYQLEYDLYVAYNKISGEIFTQGEYSTFDFLQKYRDIQNQSVIEYSDMLNTLTDIEIDKFNILLIEKNLFG